MDCNHSIVFLIAPGNIMLLVIRIRKQYGMGVKENKSLFDVKGIQTSIRNLDNVIVELLTVTPQRSCRCRKSKYLITNPICYLYSRYYL